MSMWNNSMPVTFDPFAGVILIAMIIICRWFYYIVWIFDFIQAFCNHNVSSPKGSAQ